MNYQSYLTDEGKKALYLLKVVNTRTGTVNSRIGYAFIMEEYYTKKLLLVSSTSALSSLKLPRPNGIEIQAQRYYKPSNNPLSKDPKTRSLIIDPLKLKIEKSNDPAISFVSNFGGLYPEVKSKYKFISAISKDPINSKNFQSEVDPASAIKAFVFRDKTLIAVQLAPNEEGTALEVAGDDGDENFTLDKARGAPIVMKVKFSKPGENEVLGLLECKDEQCYPVFFKVNTFDTISSGECSGVNPSMNASGGHDKTDSSHSSTNIIKGNNEKDDQREHVPTSEEQADVTTEAVLEEMAPKTDLPKNPTAPPLPQPETSKQNGESQLDNGKNQLAVGKQKVQEEKQNGSDNIDPNEGVNKKPAEEHDDQKEQVSTSEEQAASDVTTEAVLEEMASETDLPKNPTAPPLPQPETSKQISESQLDNGKNQLVVGKQKAQEEKQKGSGSKMVTGLQKPSGVSNNTSESEAKCIKSYTLADAPNTNKLFHKLKVKLDPMMPFGNDYRELAEKFGCDFDDRNYLPTQGSPTEALLRQFRTNTTLGQLYDKVLNMSERDDVVQLMESYFQQECKRETDCSCSIPR